MDDTQVINNALRSVMKLREENKMLQRKLKYAIAFVYSDNELHAYNQFCVDHASCLAHGLRPILMQSDNRLGMQTVIGCLTCGATEDITDIESW